MTVWKEQSAAAEEELEKVLSVPPQQRREWVEEVVSTPEGAEWFRTWSRDRRQPWSVALAQLRYEGWLSLARATRWGEDPRSEEGCTGLLESARAYLDNYYCPLLLEDRGEWVALPPLHQGLLHLLAGEEAHRRGEEAAVEEELTRCVELAPELAPLAVWRRDWYARPRYTPEVEGLVAEIQGLLDGCNPEDPALVALAQLPAYQRVAHLFTLPRPIEEERDTTLDEDLDTLLSVCRFDSREDAEESLDRSFGQLDQMKRLELEEQWQRDPQWGRSREEVLSNLGEVLWRHRGELTWLYGRLEDNLSRRVLLAVLRSWRFFDQEALDHVRQSAQPVGWGWQPVVDLGQGGSAALAEQAQRISEERPALKLVLSQGFLGLPGLTRLVDSLVPDYRFYLRCQGTGEWTASLTLLAMPPCP